MHKNTAIGSNEDSKHRVSTQKNEEHLQLTGSQMNLSSRSQRNPPKTPTSPCTWKSRPCSAFPSYESFAEYKSRWKRPMSADNDLTVCRMSKDRRHWLDTSLMECSLTGEEPIIPESEPNFKHCYTYMSSNLLRTLIRNPWNSECSETISNSSDLSQSEKSLGCYIIDMAQEDNSDVSLNSNGKNNGKDEDSDVTRTASGSHHTIDRPLSGRADKVNTEENELAKFKLQRWMPSTDSSCEAKSDEKMVRFSHEEEQSDDTLKKSNLRSELEYNPENFECKGLSCSTPSFNSENDEDENKSNPKEEYETFGSRVADEVCHYKKEASVKDVVVSERTCSDSCPFSCCDGSDVKSSRSPRVVKSEVTIENQEKETRSNEEKNNEIKQLIKDAAAEETPEKLDAGVNDSTYNEIVTILNVLEQGETDSLLEHDLEEEIAVKRGKKTNEQLQCIYTYLDEVEKNSQETINVAKTHLESVRTSSQPISTGIPSVPRLEDLITKNVVDLAQEILTLKLQIEDQSSGIKLLQSTIAEMKEAAKVAKSKHEDEIFKMSNEAEVAIQRHQKFIKQLLQEKKVLNEKVAKLVEDLKSSEDRHQRNLKTIEERHAIEIQRVKETQAVAEKLKREKWIDIKTQKIKEMTVKGLEPELSRMAARQQQEMTDLRKLHRSELEAVELRAARRTSELLDQLRSELTKDKEDAILRESNVLRAKSRPLMMLAGDKLAKRLETLLNLLGEMSKKKIHIQSDLRESLKLEKQFDDERSKLEHELRKLREETRREKEILESKELQMQDAYSEMKRSLEREKERDRQRIIQEFQEQMDALKRKHQNELKSVRDTLEIEKEAWMNNYKKQQSAKFLEREAELHHQYKRERDRDIEMVIERLENEASQAQQELIQTNENKLKRMKEKFEQEIKELESIESTLKSKISDAKAQLLEKDDQIADLKSQIHHVQSDMTHLKKLCEEMSAERSNLKQIVGKEYEAQLAQAEKEQEELRTQIANMKTSHILELAKRDQLMIQAKAEAEQELNQVYNRVKATVSKKEEALEVLREQHKAVLERCSHLEKMLENQRRNLLLK